jgi:hypothetical protein
VNVKFAGGQMTIDNALGGGQDLEAKFLDLKTLYQWSQYTDLSLQVSWADEDIDDLAVMAMINIKYD